MVIIVAPRAILPVASKAFPYTSSKISFGGNLTFKANFQNTTKINSISIKTRDGELSSPSSSSSIDFLKPQPGCKDLIDPLKIFEETMLVDEFATNSGTLVEDGLVYRQNVSIRSYEIGADGRVSLEALMNHLQEAGLDHMKLIGLLGDGLGSTPEMAKRKLFWVATKVQIVIDCYPTWGDEVVIDDWMVASGKTRMRRDSVIRDRKTGKTLIKASSNWVMMNKETRRLSRIPGEVLEELRPHQIEATPIIEEDKNNSSNVDQDGSLMMGLKPRWSDLDINQHVNNAKYIGWVLESAPPAIFEDHEVSRVTMEYRKECHRDDVLQSLTSVCCDSALDFADLCNVECCHLLRLEGGDEVMKARTEWRPKNVFTLKSIKHLVESHF